MAQAFVVRFRPLKLITCLCGIIAVILIIIALAGTWLTTQDEEVSDSLWKSCESPNPCRDPASTDWLNAVRSFAILSLLLCLAATVIRILGWWKGDKNIRWARIVAMVLMSAAMVSIIISLIIFPVMTLKTLPYRVRGTWQFHWAYGVAWGSVIFMVGFVVLLIIPGNVDREEDTTQKNKIYYVNTGGQFETNA